MAASFAAYFFATECVRKSPPNPKSRRRTLLWIILVALAARLVLFPSELIQEVDPFRYVWDGQAVLSGSNPYALAPVESFNNLSEAPEGVTPAAEHVFQRINYPEIRTIYPPMAQILFAAGQALSPWKLWGWRVIILMAECLTLVLLCLILKGVKIREEWVVLYAWSPLVIKEFSNSLHVDSFAVLFLCAMMWCLLKRKMNMAFIVLALAILIKWFALVLVPLLVAWSWRANKREALFGLGWVGVTIFCFYIPFLSAGVHLFEGLGRFAVEWRINDGLFGLIYSVALVFVKDPAWAGVLSRAFSLFCVVGLIAGLTNWVRRRRDPVSLLRACGVALCGLFFFSPAANPWYFTWVIPFLVFFSIEVTYSFFRTRTALLPGFLLYVPVA